MIPAYNAEEFIVETLESISQQTVGNFKVLISVDVSRDATFDVCQQYAQNDGRFSVVQQTRQQGFVGNSNFLLRMVDTPYALFVFNDDKIVPEYLETLLPLVEENRDAVVAYGDMSVTFPGGKQIIRKYPKPAMLHDRVERGRFMLRKKAPGGPLCEEFCAWSR